MSSLTIGVNVERRYLRQEMPAAVIRALEPRGVRTELICPHDAYFEPQTGILWAERGQTLDFHRYDLIVSRNRSALGLAILAYADALGVPTINSHVATQRVRNKAKMAGALTRAGVRCPPTVLADHVSALARLGEEWFPLILKATYGDNSQGLRLIRRREDLGDIRWSEGLVLAQHYLPNEGLDLKLYVCGTTVFAVRKPSPFNGNSRAMPQFIRPDAEMVELALRCGATFGLDVYGVDAIETAEGPAVIEVNEFPNFTGVPGAADHIADFLIARLTDQGVDGAYRPPVDAVGH